jgi:hypothetical protein
MSYGVIKILTFVESLLRHCHFQSLPRTMCCTVSFHGSTSRSPLSFEVSSQHKKKKEASRMFRTSLLHDLLAGEVCSITRSSPGVQNMTRGI